jgi:hypothetical protein
VNVDELQPRRHEAPPGWLPEVFAAVTSALAAALVKAYQRGGAHVEDEPYIEERPA